MRVTTHRALVATVFIAVLASSVLAQKRAASNNSARSKVADTFQLPPIPIEEFKLENGLRVILSRDTSVPVVSVAVYYSVGSRDERKGRTGFAHLFEHMMYQGSENVGKGDYMKAVQNAGGTLNGTTSTERTNYFVTLPSNQLPLALWLESDRMRSLKVTQENLENQRSVVKEEKRFRVDNQPYVPAYVRFTELVFQNFANAHASIGSMEDLDAANLADVQEFFRIYYAPNNAVLTIVGDFDPKEARSLVEKYFATIPRQPAPPAVDVNEPAEVARRQDSIKDQFAPLGAFLIGWKIPPRRTPDYYALSLASDLLFEGDSSRLYQKLVKGDESVVSIQGGIDSRRGPSAISLFITPKPGKDAAQIRQTIMSEIKRLATEGPSTQEMEKLRNSLYNDAARGRQVSLYRAQRLAEFALYDGDPNIFNTELDRYLSVTAAQIKEAVARYMDTENRAVLDIVPAAAPAKAAPPANAHASGEVQQPSAPPPQLPSKPPAQPATTNNQPATPLQPVEPRPEQPQQPTDTPAQNEPGAQPVRP
jgi:zinc protease